MAVGCVATMNIIGFFIFLLVVINQKRKHQRKIHEQEKALLIEEKKKQKLEAQNKILERELRQKRISLRQVLQQRVQMTRTLQHYASNERKKREWLEEYIQKNLLVTDASWEIFAHEFDSVYAGLIPRLQTTYPALSKKDIQIISLTILGMSIEDICFLLHLSERTIWNRRQTIKNRLGDPKMDLDKWISDFSTLFS